MAATGPPSTLGSVRWKADVQPAVCNHVPAGVSAQAGESWCLSWALQAPIWLSDEHSWVQGKNKAPAPLPPSLWVANCTEDWERVP